MVKDVSSLALWTLIRHPTPKTRGSERLLLHDPAPVCTS
jgi:hypothetical protein